MKNETRFLLTAVSSLILVAAAWATPRTTHNTNIALQAPAQAQTQSATGTISAVDKSSFTITLAATPSGSVATTPVAQQDAPKSMTFVIDKNTTIEGKLQVGSSADVTYRDDQGNHVAIGVRVAPPQS